MQFGENEIDALQHYKFKGVDRSFLYYHCGLTYWSRILSITPRWIAPNAITLAGFFAVVAQACFVLYSDPGLQGSTKWTCVFSAGAMWFYSTMDCLDGMQARRIGAASPLGQLFDHGVDSVVCTLIVLFISSGLGVKNKKSVLFFLSTVQTVFYWVTAKEYYTHVFYLGFIGPTEAIAAGCALLLALGVFGRGKARVLHPWIKQSADHVLQQACFLVWCACTVYHIVYISSSTGFGFSKEMSFLQMFLALVPHILFVALQIMSFFSVMDSKSIAVAKVFYLYLVLQTACFSLFTTLIIHSHQIRSCIKVPVMHIILTCVANLAIVFVPLKKTVPCIFIISGLALAFYLVQVSDVIHRYVVTLKIPFFFNNAK